MNIALNAGEAIKRMSQRSTQSVSWTLKDMTVEWQYIPATAARNRDGSSAGSGEDPSRVILQQKVWRTGDNPRFTNWW